MTLNFLIKSNRNISDYPNRKMALWFLNMQQAGCLGKRQADKTKYRFQSTWYSGAYFADLENYLRCYCNRIAILQWIHWRMVNITRKSLRSHSTHSATHRNLYPWEPQSLSETVHLIPKRVKMFSGTEKKGGGQEIMLLEIKINILMR